MSIFRRYISLSSWKFFEDSASRKMLGQCGYRAHIKTNVPAAGAMAPCLRAAVSLVDDLDLILYTHLVTLNLLLTSEDTRHMYIYKRKHSRAVVAHTFNSSTWEAEAGGFLSSRPAWPTK